MRARRHPRRMAGPNEAIPRVHADPYDHGNT